MKHGKCVGGRVTTEYQIWVDMRRRCNDPRRTAYKNYGGRGIRVCRRWDNFENFYKDMGPRPDGRSLDRRDNTKGYNRTNCRWATRSEQRQNRRSLPYKCAIMHEGRHINEWMIIWGIGYSAAKSRIYRSRK